MAVSLALLLLQFPIAAVVPRKASRALLA